MTQPCVNRPEEIFTHARSKGEGPHQDKEGNNTQAVFRKGGIGNRLKNAKGGLEAYERSKTKESHHGHARTYGQSGKKQNKEDNDSDDPY